MKMHKVFEQFSIIISYLGKVYCQKIDRLPWLLAVSFVTSNLSGSWVIFCYQTTTCIFVISLQSAGGQCYYSSIWLTNGSGHSNCVSYSEIYPSEWNEQRSSEVPWMGMNTFIFCFKTKFPLAEKICYSKLEKLTLGNLHVILPS